MPGLNVITIVALARFIKYGKLTNSGVCVHGITGHMFEFRDAKSHGEGAWGANSFYCVIAYWSSDCTIAWDSKYDNLITVIPMLPIKRICTQTNVPI